MIDELVSDFLMFLAIQRPCSRSASPSAIVGVESRMRALFAAILIVLPALAAGQSPRADDRANPTLPPIGLPLPPIGLPLPSLAPPQAGQPVRRGDRRSPPNQRQRRGDDNDGRKGGRPPRSVVYVVPGYYPVAAPSADAARAEVDRSPQLIEATGPTGTLWLDVPNFGIAQLYVDGFYVGTTVDVGSQLTLEAGPHSIELRAPGYETMKVSVKIEAGRAITYRDTLRSMSSPAAAEPPKPAVEKVQAERKPFYVIPGCYVGDVPPKDARLPATCDQSRAKTIQR